MKRAHQIVEQSRRIGAMLQWSHPLLCWLRDTGMRLTPPSAMLRRLRPTLTFRDV